MANLQVKNIPDSLHQRLRRYVRKHGLTLSDFVLEAIKRELSRSEWLERLSKRSMTDLGISAAALLEQERQQRDGEIE
jgi:plasmid stability protein